MRNRVTRSVLTAMITGLVAACHAPGTVAGGPSPATSDLSLAVTPTRTSAQASRVQADELTGAEAANLREALERVRPEFLRGTSVVTMGTVDMVAPTVYINGRYAGERDVLQLVLVAEVTEVKFLRPNTARLTFGGTCPCSGGVIAVTTRSAR